MASYSLFGAVSDLIGLASTVTVVVWLVSSLRPLFERARDSCRACQPPEGRVRLLSSAFLIYVAWVAAAALYSRILFSLWDVMGTWLEAQPVNRPVYALLHLYLLFLLVCGGCACAITIVEILQNRKVLSDLWLIARFDGREYKVIEDMEAQHRPSSPDLTDSETEMTSVIGDISNTSSLPQDDWSCKNNQELNEDVAPSGACTDEAEDPTVEPTWSEIDHPNGETVTRAAYSPIRWVETKFLVCIAENK